MPESKEEKRRLEELRKREESGVERRRGADTHEESGIERRTPSKKEEDKKESGH